MEPPLPHYVLAACKFLSIIKTSWFAILWLKLTPLSKEQRKSLLPNSAPAMGRSFQIVLSKVDTLLAGNASQQHQQQSGRIPIDMHWLQERLFYCCLSRWISHVSQATALSLQLWTALMASTPWLDYLGGRLLLLQAVVSHRQYIQGCIQWVSPLYLSLGLHLSIVWQKISTIKA